jgi:hypothetical protein
VPAHDHELLAAQPRQRVGIAGALAQDLRHRLQHRVADVVAVAVVDALEVVDVHDDDRELLRVAAATHQLLVEHLVELAPVVQPGQALAAFATRCSPERGPRSRLRISGIHTFTQSRPASFAA